MHVCGYVRLLVDCCCLLRCVVVCGRAIVCCSLLLVVCCELRDVCCLLW